MKNFLVGWYSSSSFFVVIVTTCPFDPIQLNILSWPYRHYALCIIATVSFVIVFQENILSASEVINNYLIDFSLFWTYSKAFRLSAGINVVYDFILFFTHTHTLNRRHVCDAWLKNGHQLLKLFLFCSHRKEKIDWLTINNCLRTSLLSDLLGLCVDFFDPIRLNVDLSASSI